MTHDPDDSIVIAGNCFTRQVIGIGEKSHYALHILMCVNDARRVRKLNYTALT